MKLAAWLLGAIPTVVFALWMADWRPYPAALLALGVASPMLILYSVRWFIRRFVERSVCLALVTLLALTGCMSTAPEHWSLSPDEQTRAKRDIYECKADAQGVSDRATAFGGVFMPVIGLFQRRTQFNECMEARGYTKP